MRLNELGFYRKGPFGSSLTKDMFVPYSKSAIKVYEQKNAIQKDYRLGHYYISDTKFNQMQSFVTNPGDIIVSCAGTIGETYQLPDDAPIGIINQALMRVCLYDKSISDYWQMSFDYILLVNSEMKGAGSAIKNIPPFDVLKSLLVPIPPIAEQNRILSQYRILQSKIRAFETLNSDLERLNSTIFEKLKKSVLQEAIQGKLVPQDPNDETASVLLERIKEEKAKLFKQGKLKKKDLVDSVIFKGEDNKYYETIGSQVTCIDEEIPFEIPDRWAWARGKTIFMPMQSTRPTGESFTYIDVDAVNNRKNIIDNAKCVPTSTAPSRATRKVWHNSILFSMVRPYLKNIALVGKEYCNAIASTGFYVIRPSIHLYPEYIFQLMLSAYVVDGLNKFMKGDNSPSINNEHIEEFLYPIPPAKEQQRIICKLSELLPIMK